MTKHNIIVTYRKRGTVTVRPNAELDEKCPHDECGYEYVTDWPEVEFSEDRHALTYARSLRESEEFRDWEIEIVNEVDYGKS